MHRFPSPAQGNDDLVFAFTFEPINATQGAEIKVLLQADDIKVPIVTTGTRVEMDDLFVLEGRAVLDARLTDLITSRGTLHVFVEDGAKEFPLEGAREAADALIETCVARAGQVEIAGVEACAISAWSTDPDPNGLKVLAAPDSNAPIIGTLPSARRPLARLFESGHALGARRRRSGLWT